jgi:hypothetical protein
MPQRLAVILALLVFAACLFIGLEAENSFTTTLSRALVAMAGTYVVGWGLGTAAQKMLDEDLESEKEKLKNSEAKVEPRDR